MKKKVLILIPRAVDGGLANYFNSIKEKFTFQVVFFERGAKNWPQKSNLISNVVRLFSDYRNFYKKTRTKDFSLIHLNTFFGFKGLIRESMFILISLLLGNKTVMFFRGWDEETKDKIEKYFLFFFKKIYFTTEAMIVLSSSEKEILQRWGYKKHIYIETTVVNENLLKGISYNFILNKENDVQHFNLLFLSRIEKAKGIYETIDAFHLLTKNINSIELTIAGTGSELNNVRKYVESLKINNIRFLGFVEGEKKIETLKTADIFIFPSYSEGMPNAVLEAFAFGLPVVTRYVGGLMDIFKDGENGFITHSKDPKVFAGNIERLINDKELRLKISLNNYQYAKENFTSSVVVKRLERIYASIVN